MDPWWTSDQWSRAATWSSSPSDTLPLHQAPSHLTDPWLCYCWHLPWQQSHHHCRSASQEHCSPQNQRDHLIKEDLNKIVLLKILPRGGRAESALQSSSSSTTGRELIISCSGVTLISGAAWGSLWWSSGSWEDFDDFIFCFIFQTVLPLAPLSITNVSRLSSVSSVLVTARMKLLSQKKYLKESVGLNQGSQEALFDNLRTCSSSRLVSHFSFKLMLGMNPTFWNREATRSRQIKK